ncbi:hypothetical protein RJ55_04540 [Drechmeria coniospora]|nr:hypothetical protein RJ55_04540 [Drechmeria coniospora]
MRTTTWSSESSSESDGLLYRISRQFPPQFPAPASSHASILRSRSVATNRITAWVSQYENLQSIRETRRMATHPFPPSVDAGSAGDNSSFSGASSYAEVQLLWTRLKERRSKVGRIKTQMAQKRQELRQLRYRKDKADNEFMNVFRPVLARSAGYFQISVQELNSHVADMQDLRDEYHSQEEEYETLELLMDVEERELSALETTFFSLLAAGRTNSERVSPSGSNASESAKDNLPSEMPFELTGISADRALEDVHPLYLQLTRAVAYRQNAKEEYEDLLLLKKQYEYEADVQTKLGKGATNDTDEFLDEFPTEEARMKADVVKLGQRVDRLKRLCEDKKIMREHMSIGMVYALDPSIKFDDVQLDDVPYILANHKTLAHSTFPKLLSQPDHLLEPTPQTPKQALRAASLLPNDDPRKLAKQRLAAKECSIDSLMQPQMDSAGDRGDFVNRWLLHQLRLSPLHAQLLHSTFVSTLSCRIPNLSRWQCDVLHHWWHDNTTATTADAAATKRTSTGPDHSSRLRTRRMSRAASDGRPGRNRTVAGCKDAVALSV